MITTMMIKGTRKAPATKGNHFIQSCRGFIKICQILCPSHFRSLTTNDLGRVKNEDDSEWDKRMDHCLWKPCSRFPRDATAMDFYSTGGKWRAPGPFRSRCCLTACPTTDHSFPFFCGAKDDHKVVGKNGRGRQKRCCPCVNLRGNYISFPRPRRRRGTPPLLKMMMMIIIRCSLRGRLLLSHSYRVRLLYFWAQGLNKWHPDNLCPRLSCHSGM